MKINDINTESTKKLIGGYTPAEDLYTLKDLRKFLCDNAKPVHGPVRVNACRSCISQCAYGRRYVELYEKEKAESETKSRKEEKREEKNAEPVTVPYTVRKESEETTALQKLVDELKRQNDELIAVNDVLIDELTELRSLTIRMKVKLFDLVLMEDL